MSKENKVEGSKCGGWSCAESRAPHRARLSKCPAGVQPAREPSGSAQGDGEGEVVSKGTPAGPVDLKDGDPGGERDYPEEEAHGRTPDICKGVEREQEGAWTSPPLLPLSQAPGSLHHPPAGLPPLTAFDLALLGVGRGKEGLSEEPENVDQPEKRQESEPS